MRNSPIAGKWLCSILVSCLLIATGARAQETEADESAPAADQALLVLAIDPPITSGGFSLRAANLETGKFGETRISFDYAAWTIFGEGAIRAHGRSHAAFLVESVPVGAYIATFEYFNDTNVVSYIQTYRCTAEQAAVIEVRAGQLNVVRSNEIYPPGIIGRLSGYVTDEVLLEEFASARATRPELTRDAVLLRPIATAAWTPARRGSHEQRCNNAEDFRVLRRFPASAAAD